jgi:hypothetical protein
MGVLSIPKMILIDRQGIIRWVGAGGTELDKTLQGLIDDKG